jgi:hypothetical protein
MDQQKPRKPNWGLTAAMGVGVVIWQVYDIANATEAPPTSLLALQYFLIACGTVSGLGGLVMAMKVGGAAR